MTETCITVALYPRNTLMETWLVLAKTLADSGAQPDQIDTMRAIFFLGAAQTYARIDGNATSFPTFCDIMHSVHVEIDDEMGGIGNVAGERMSWKAEVQVANNPKWYDNAVRFKSRDEALKYGRDLFNRWTVAERWHVVESDDDVTAAWVNNRVEWKEVNYPQTTVDDHDL